MNSTRMGLGLMFLLWFSVSANAQQRRSPTSGTGELYRIEFEYRNWNAKLVSEIEVGSDPSNVSLTDDLGLPDERIHHFMGAVRIVSWLKVRGSYFKREYDAGVTIRRDLTIAGTTLPALSNVDTAQSLEYLTAGAEGDLYASEYFVFSAVGDYTRFRTETLLGAAEGSNVDLGQRELALLTLGLKLRIYLTPNFSVTGEASGMKRTGSGVLTNLDGLATYNFGRNFAVSFGYQHRYARLDQGDREVFRLKGAYFGASVRF